jgi:WD40 repeat protein
MQTYPNNDRQIGDFAFLSEDRMLFARGVNPDALLFWDVQTGTLLHELPIDILDSELGNPAVLSPDGRLLLMLDGDGTIRVWGVPSRD